MKSNNIRKILSIILPLLVILFLLFFLIIRINRIKGDFKISIAENKFFYEDNIFEYVKRQSNFFQLNDELKSIFKKDDRHYILIYRYFSDECSPCILEDLKNIKAVNFDKDLLYILPESSLNREEKIGLSSLLEGFNYIPVCDTIIRLNRYQNYDKRFFALIDDKGKASMIFIPQKQLPELTKKYLEFIHNYLINNN